MTREPEHLARGKAFHRRLQTSWSERHGGIAPPEIERVFAAADLAGRRRVRRFDIDVTIERFQDDEGNSYAFVVLLEAKSRRFDRLTPHSTRRLIARDRRQILTYVELITSVGLDGVDPERMSVAPSLVYEIGPRNPVDRAAIEAYFDQLGVGVIWEDESVDQAAARLLLQSPEEARDERDQPSGRSFL